MVKMSKGRPKEVIPTKTLDPNKAMYKKIAKLFSVVGNFANILLFCSISRQTLHFHNFFIIKKHASGYPILFVNYEINNNINSIQS